MASINFDIRGDNSNFLRSVQGAQRGVQTSISQIEKATGGVTRTFNQMKESAVGGFKQIAMGMAGITALLQSGSFLKGLIDEMGEFTVAMKEVSTLSQDVTRDLEGWKAKVVDLTTEIPIGAVEAAKAMYQIESAGHHGADAMNVLKESAKGAIAGVTETETVADAITTILNSYNMKAEEAAHVNDLLFTTVRLGKTRMDELAHTIAQAAPIASTYGVAIEEVLAAVATLTKSGTPTAMAMRQVRSAIVAVTKSLGDGAFEGKRFIDAMQEVANGTGESMNALRKELANLQALNGVLAMTGKNYSRAEQDLEDMKNSTNAASDAYDKMADTAGNSATLLKNNLFKALEPIGDSMKGFSKSITDALNEGFNTGAVQNFADALGALALTYGIYRAAIASTNAVQSIQTATMTAGYKTEIAELDALIATQETEISVRMQEAVAKGQITAEQATLITSLQGEVAARRQQLAVAAEDLAMKATQAEAALQLAVSEKAAADSMLASAQERLAAARASNVQTEIDIATEEVRIATLMQGTAAENVNVASHQASIATQSAETAAKVANTAATVTETGAVSGDTVATGLLASAKTALTAVQNALNASMLASPLFWIAAVIAGVTYAVYELATAESAHDAAVRSTNEALEEQAKQIEERKNNTNSLIRKIQDANATEYERVKAYEELKNLAPEITKEYTRQELAALDAADAQKEVNEAFDNIEYEEAKKKLDEYSDILERFAKKDWANVDFDKLEEELDLPFWANIGDVERAVEAAADKYREKILEIEELNRKVVEEQEPIEIRIQEAEENEKVRQDIYDFYDEALAVVEGIEDMNVTMTFEDSRKNFDDYILQVEERLDDLHRQVEANPLDQKLQLKYSEGQKVFNLLTTMRAQWIASGATTLPLYFDIALRNAHLLAAGEKDKVTGEVNRLKTEQQAAKAKASSKPRPTGDGSKKKSKAPKTKTSKGGGDKTDPEQIKADVEKIMNDLREDVEEFNEDISIDIAEGITAAMKEGREKEVQEIRDSTKADLKELQEKADKMKKSVIEANREIWEKEHPKEKKYKYKVPDEEAFEQFMKRYPEIRKQYDAMEKSIAERRKQIQDQSNSDIAKINKEARDEEATNLNEYLIQYGTYQEKRKAIADKYSRLIAESQSEGQKRTYEAQMREETSQLDMEQFKKSVNWEQVFSDLDSLSVATLESLKKRLREQLSVKDISAENAKIIMDQIQDIDNALSSRKNGWKDAFGLVIPEIEEQKRKIEELKRANNELSKAEQKAALAQTRVIFNKQQIAQFLKDNGKEFSGDINMTNQQSIMEMFANDGNASKKLSTLFGNLASSEQSATESTDALANAQTNAAVAAEGAGGSIANTVAVIDAVVSKVNANVQSAVDLFDQMGLSDTKFGKGFSSFAESSQYAADAWNALKEGNIMGVANGVVGSLRSLGNALGEWGIGIFGASDKDLEKDVERLTASNEALEKAVQELTDEMKEAAVAEAAELYAKMIEDLKASEQNTREMLQRSGAAYNNGFFGIGGKHSSNYNIDQNISASEWARASKAAGVSVRSAGQFWALTSEQMHRIAVEAPDVYAHIKQYADEGFADASAYMDEYIEYWKKLQDAEDAYHEKLTSTTFDTISSDFASALMDMDKSSADFAESFENYMKTAIINALVSEKYKPLLEEWYGDFADAMVDGVMSDTEAAALRNRWTQITNMGLADRDMLQKQFGWGSTGEGSGAYKAASSFTQEQGDELNGRLAALQIGQERINANVSQAIEQLRGLSVFFVDGGGVLGEIRNLVMMGNSHLEDISRYTRIASQYGDMINEIANKIKTL